MPFPSRRTLVLLGVLHLAALGAGVATAAVLSRELPPIGNLDLLRLPRMTVLSDRNGERLHSFAEQRRNPVTLDQISPHFVNALLATEDPRFNRHIGVDLKAVSRAIYANLTSGFGAQGGSTITQQLARDQFLYPRKTIARKAQEAILALTIEKNYTKREILELYCNRIYLGSGRYGVDAAAQFFFGKKARDLSLAEAALLAGLPQRPEGYSPLKSPERALARRNHVLDRMVVEGLLDARTAAETKKAPLGIVRTGGRRAASDYFVEDVRRFLVKQFGEETVYRSGLIVKTTLDPVLQLAAERAVRIGLDGYGRRHRMIPAGRDLPAGALPSAYHDEAWDDPPREGDILPALSEFTSLQTATLRVGDHRFTLGPKDVEWTGRRTFAGMLVPGKLYPVKVLEVDGAGRIASLDLASDPPVEASFLALDPQSGDVLAMVGGKDFDRSEFNRATQAERQAGSAFKPFIYAAGVELGFMPSQAVLDVPTVWVESGQPEPYQPENYDVKYEGLITLQYSLEHSRNIPTVRLLDALGYQPAIEMAQRLGVKSGLRPYPSLALGAFEARLVDLVAAYGAFINGGTLVSPQIVRSVTSPDGQELWSSTPATREVLTPDVAATMVSMLEGTTTRGTAAEAAKLGRPTMGKTGTTDDFTDAWFIGGTPSIAAGAWIGYDQRQSLGRGETGGKAALPIWMAFIADGLSGRSAEEFPAAPDALSALVDVRTGGKVRPESGCEKPVMMTFTAQHEPARFCSARDHQRASLPYPLQRFPMRGDGALVMSEADAVALHDAAPDRFRLDPATHALQWSWGDLFGTSPLALTITNRPPPVYGAQRGRDGFPAEIVTINRTGAVKPLDVPLDPP